jgi:hypothetical protein
MHSDPGRGFLVVHSSSGPMHQGANLPWPLHVQSHVKPPSIIFSLFLAAVVTPTKSKKRTQREVKRGLHVEQMWAGEKWQPS